MNDEEVEIVIDHRSDGYYQARAFHRATGTIKISELSEDREQAIQDATEGLALLIEERQKGLGQKSSS